MTGCDMTEDRLNKIYEMCYALAAQEPTLEGVVLLNRAVQEILRRPPGRTEDEQGEFLSEVLAHPAWSAIFDTHADLLDEATERLSMEEIQAIGARVDAWVAEVEG